LKESLAIPGFEKEAARITKTFGLSSHASWILVGSVFMRKLEAWNAEQTT